LLRWRFTTKGHHRSGGRALLRYLFRGGLLIALLSLSAQEARSQPCEPGWDTYPNFQTNTVYAVFEHEGIVYRGGWFSLFRWNGSEWETFGGHIGGDAGTLFAADIRTYGGVLVIGGHFPTAGETTVNSIATWDGAVFGEIGGGVDGEVISLVTYNGDLIAGGRFEHAGGVPARNIARWDGSAWHPLGSGVFDAIPDGTTDGVQDMVVWQGDLYVVGDFTHAGGMEVNYVARWDGSTWSDVDGGISMIDGGPTGLRGVDVYDDSIVIVGALDFAGGVEAINIAQWDGVVWSPLGPGSDPYGGPLDLRQAALSVASYGDFLYVGADFSETVNPNASALARWDGQRWKAVDRGLENNEGPFGVPSVRDLEVCEGSLLMGGIFDEANNDPTDNLARYTDCDAVSGVDIAQPSEGYKLSSRAREITFSIPYATSVSLRVYDVGGKLLSRLVNGLRSAGEHTVVWRGRTLHGSRVATGVYLAQLSTPDVKMTCRVVLVR
jgi:hypothetical protein